MSKLGEVKHRNKKQNMNDMDSFTENKNIVSAFMVYT